MSRPPIHRPVASPRRLTAADAGGEARYFGLRFHDLVDLATRLAGETHGIEIPGKGRGLARTLVEIPALLAHILGEHTSLYAREAFLGTARLPDSLWRHARKLAYAPDAGVAATGLAVFTVKPDLAGELPKGFALQSAPKGEVKAQTYETLAAARVDAAWNALRPVDAQVATPMTIVGGLIALPLLRRHGLDRGELVLLEGQGRAGVFRVEDPMTGATPPGIQLRRLDAPGATETWPVVAAGYRLHVRPRTDARVFGWNATASLYPPAAVAAPTAYTSPPATAGAERHGYVLPADPTAPAASLGSELFLAEAIEAPDAGEYAVLLRGGGALGLRIAGATDRMVTFKRGVQMRLPDPPAESGSGGSGGSGGAGGAGGSGSIDTSFMIVGNLGLIEAVNSLGEMVTTFVPTTSLQIIESSIGGRVTALRLTHIAGGAALTWTTADPFPLDGVLLTGWDDVLDVAPTVPNDAAFAVTVDVAADLRNMRPGQPVILRRTDTGEAREAAVAALIAPADTAPGTADGSWRLVLSLSGAALTAGWRKGNVEILGNVAKVSHGEAKTEDLGGSDGVTPHQSFSLKGVPVTRLPGALGADLALEIRVDGVLWDRVEDFHEIPPEDRVYTSDTDAEGVVSVRFGGEGRGAVLPAGKRNVGASYRVGLGTIGDIEAGRLSRIRKASPLLDAVDNPLPIRGGADPVGAEHLAVQATRPVRIFDRAVSVADYADLALLFPGVARTSARWLGRGAVELVAADAAGQAIADQAALRAFLDARRDTGVPLVLLDPQAVDVAVAIRVERDVAWLADAVRLAVQEALIGTGTPPGRFTFAARALSEPEPLSALYALLRALPGVTGVEATRFAIKPGIDVADILHATDRQWLTLAPADLEIDVIEPGQLVPDVTEAGA